MPQKDRFKDRTIPIEFEFYDNIISAPMAQRCSIVLITYGSVTVKINGHIRLLTSPCALCISMYDTLEVLHRDNLSAKTFHFDPWYIKACLNFDNLDEEVEIDSQYQYDRTKLYMFTKHNDNFQGAIALPPINYMRVNELMLMIGAETYAQSDGFWTCRIRRMLLQLINCLYDVYVDQRKLKLFDEPPTLNPASICAEYIHNNYMEDITLNQLCDLVNLNRTSLNEKFKAQFSCSCMEYLLNHRLKISQELLSNTNMKITEIAENCGFKYSSYFNKQFTQKLGISPATYRKSPLSYSAYEKGPVRQL